ncbi:MAG: ArsB/NhaD family transporter [Acidimicrobiales bacterium]
MGTLLLVFAAAGPLVDLFDIAARLDGVTDRQLAAAGAALSGVATNLAAVLLLEPAATTDKLQVALLVGVDLGVGLTPVASLATVLWADALRRRAQPVPWRAYLRLAVPLERLCLLATPLLARLGT